MQAGFPANRYTAEMTSTTSVDVSFEMREMVILGTEYAGENEKRCFYGSELYFAQADIFSMHCSANVVQRVIRRSFLVFLVRENDAFCGSEAAAYWR